MRRFSEKLASFMYGRYGADKLNFVLLALYILICIIRGFVRITAAKLLLSFLALGLFVLIFYRMLSRDVVRRAAENDRFVKVFGRVGAAFSLLFKKIRDPKHKYARCPNCGAVMRFSRIRGNHTATCARCRRDFKVNVIFGKAK